ncbi:hypothetical protein KVJ46_001360 [Enterococcus faecalis]|uniref:hypothetical protein n=1 Tax=Enterococcus faecalis TaxID=1351 RepID=UPI0005355266|nr:hypothetical protein [Enterococcus faecalis]EGO9051631.1 hypothetical protein [Enterococcus faecalis]EHH3130686.1 hypothetical protein [Enterococcus faecalis]EHS2085471.1 hypothetical protein [Enterococcus faecalis]HAP2777975.1 hypothetical protein [Enterococcus faecalis]
MGEKRNRKVYVLKLKNGGYYVGHTSRDINKVFQYHLRGDFVNTKENPPIEIIEVAEIGYIEHHEGNDRVTEKRIEYMLSHGIEAVYGGDVASLKLASRLLDVAILSINDRYKDAEKLRPLVEAYKGIPGYELIEQTYKTRDMVNELEKRRKAFGRSSGPGSET